MDTTSSATASSTDRIEKQIVMRAPRSRVWRAIADSNEFASWFGMRLGGAFVAGARLEGKIFNPPGYEKIAFDILVERVEPERLLSYRWHPGAVEPDFDYSKEPMTLVEFTLDEVPGGTRLTVVESGFDRLPAARRKSAFDGNARGWAIQVERVRAHVEK